METMDTPFNENMRTHSCMHPPSMETRRFGRTKKQAGGLIGRVECWSIGAGRLAQVTAWRKARSAFQSIRLGSMK